ncbi:hypothetical protein E3J74_01490 [Candidatus Bathyarchaeota archaeon]|nr:MAG: hypothetical protein E3J74_01490 [Candidatus Bathyarchaeota archaeon]
MVQGGKKAFIARVAIRNEFKRHGAHGISPALVDIVIERLGGFLDTWCEEALVNKHERGRKVVRAFDLQDYWDEEKRKLDLLKSAICRFCGRPLKPEDVCDGCYRDKMATIYNGYDEILRKASGRMNKGLFLKMTSAFTNIRRQDMRVPKLKALTGV